MCRVVVVSAAERTRQRTTGYFICLVCRQVWTRNSGSTDCRDDGGVQQAAWARRDAEMTENQ